MNPWQIIGVVLLLVGLIWIVYDRFVAAPDPVEGDDAPAAVEPGE